MLWYLTTRGGEERGRTAQGFANATVTWVIAQRISETRTMQRSGPATSWAAVQPRWGAMMKTTAHIVSIFTSPKQTFQVLSCIMSNTCMKANYRKQSCKTSLFFFTFSFWFHIRGSTVYCGWRNPLAGFTSVFELIKSFFTV